jgi:2',3'-cyclic-nucleotide 2'-phosphodiesterase/3'-nucleotidase
MCFPKKKASKFENRIKSLVHMLKNIANIRLIYVLFPVLSVLSACKKDAFTVRIAATTDVHGMIYPHDFINRTSADHSLAHIYNYVLAQRAKKDMSFFLLDNGDFLQGQPTVYFYNFVDTLSEHLSARVMNFMEYDAGTVGNHDIEAGSRVYDRLVPVFNFPWLAANAVDSSTGSPYFEPYAVLKAGRIKIAVLGLITPGIPDWLPKNLWPRMEFRDMVESAEEWVPRILEKEDPDLLVGLFHSGTDASYGGDPGEYMNENAVMLVAEKVPGFHVIFAGHDHRVSVQRIANLEGDSVLIIDPGSHCRYAGEATIRFKGREILSKGTIIPMSDHEPSEAFMTRFAREFDLVADYLDDTLTWLAEDMAGLDALFGPSSLSSLIHRVQLDLSGAEISFTAPLSISAVLEQGPLLVSDLFKLYRFENMLYRMELTGHEIDGFLEHAAGVWFNTMTGPGDHLLQFDPDREGRLAAPYYNFSSAAGIRYTVDVTRPPGERVRIDALSDGTPFVEDQRYSVAVNSYRGSGGGGHLTAGAGIPKEELAERISWTSERDIRYYLMEHLMQEETLTPHSEDNWACIPAHLTGPASLFDRKVLD